MLCMVQKALELHPDVTRGTVDDSARFLEVIAAYEACMSRAEREGMVQHHPTAPAQQADSTPPKEADAKPAQEVGGMSNYDLTMCLCGLGSNPNLTMCIFLYPSGQGESQLQRGGGGLLSPSAAHTGCMLCLVNVVIMGLC